MEPQSEREAWERAQDGIYNHGFGNISEEEVSLLVKYPAAVSFEHYQRLKTDFREEAPELPIIKPDVTDGEIFFYLTRGYLPEIPQLRQYVDRLYHLEHFVEETIRGLLLRLYNDDKRLYALHIGEPRPLEDLLLAYNNVMGIPGLVTALAEANNINLSSYKDADIGFLTEIEARI